METKQRFITMIIAFVAMFMGTKVMAQEAYAVLSDDGKTFTFRYDSSKSSYGNKAYYLNEGNNLPGWNGITTVETVVFEESFATARPVSTYSWFEGLTSLGSIVNIENLNTSEVTTMSQMFQNCSNLTSVTLSGFDTKNVTNMSHLFFGCSSLKSVDLSGFDTQNVTTTARMFFGCSSLTSIKLNGINTSNVEFMSFMFSGCQGLTSLDLSSFNTTNVRYMNSMFNGCGNLKTITVGVNWTTDNVPVTSSLYMFSGCTSLVGGAGTTYNSDKVDKEYARIDGGESDPGYLSLPPEAYAVLSNDGKTLTFYYDGNRSSYGSNTYDVNSSFPTWTSSSRTVETVVFEESFEDARLTSTWFWFDSMNNLSSIIGLEYLNTSEVTNMSYMFAGCYKLSEINLSRFNTSKVTNMSNMFLSCSSLKTLDLSSFNTQSVTDMQSMFGWCLELETIIVGENWSTEQVTSSDYMFSGCTSIIGGAGTIFDENHLDKGYAHIDEGTSDRGYLSATLPEAYAALSNDGKTLTFRYDSNKSSYGSNAYYLNEGNNLPGWNGITTIETVVFEESFATVRPVSTRSWFDGFNSLTEFVGMEYLNTSEVTTMEAMFGGCKSITNLDLSHFNTSKVTNMQSMFVTCEKLKEINLRGFDTSKVTSMQIMFIGCVVLETLNLGSFNTSNVTNMQMMFGNCSMLKTIYVGGGWSVANAGCFGMFTECKKLTGGQGTTYDAGHTAADYAHIDGGESDLGYLTAAPPEAYAVYDSQAKTLTFCYDMNKSIYGENGYYLNEGNTAPGWIDFSNPKDIRKVVFTSPFQNVLPVSTYNWFYNLPSLTEIVDIKYLNTSSVENMSGMFYNCSSLTELDVSGFDTQNVTTMSLMFDRCSGLTNLYLVNFDTRNVSKMHYMFEGCTNLTTITVGVNWNTTNVESSDNMFYGCTSIVGGAGTTYNINKVDKEYARIDGGTSNPGYLTALTYNLKLAGVRVTAANQNNVLGNGIFTYVPSSKTLKVKGSYSSSLDVPLIESSIDGLIIDVMQDAVLEASSTQGNQVFWLKDGTTTMLFKC